MSELQNRRYKEVTPEETVKKLKGLLIPLLILPLVFYFYLVYSNPSFNFLHKIHLFVFWPEMISFKQVYFNFLYVSIQI